MKHQTGSGKVEEVLGQKLSTPITFPFEWDEFETPQELRDAGKYPNDSAIVSFQNANEKRNAMSNARAKAVADEVSRIQDTPEFKLGEIIKSIMAGNSSLSYDKAKALAEMAMTTN